MACEKGLEGWGGVGVCVGSNKKQSSMLKPIACFLPHCHYLPCWLVAVMDNAFGKEDIGNPN